MNDKARIVDSETGEEFTVTAVSGSGFAHNVCMSCGAEYLIEWRNPNENPKMPIVMWGCCEKDVAA